MRRRDADDHGAFRGAAETHRAVLLCVAVSIALHAALLVAAATLRAVRPSAPAPIHVSLVSGNGGEPAGGSTDGDPGPPAPAHVPPHSASVPQPVHANHGRKQAAARPPHEVGDVGQPGQVLVDVEPKFDPHAVGVASAYSGRGQETSGDGLTGSGRGRSPGGGRGDGLDARAFCSYCPEPTYPLIARSRGWQGTVEVALTVRGDGSVNGASLGRSSGYPALDDAALTVARLSRFHLRDNDGLSTPLRGRMEYRFILR